MRTSVPGTTSAAGRSTMQTSTCPDMNVNVQTGSARRAPILQGLVVEDHEVRVRRHSVMQVARDVEFVDLDRALELFRRRRQHGRTRVRQALLWHTVQQPARRLVRPRTDSARHVMIVSMRYRCRNSSFFRSGVTFFAACTLSAQISSPTSGLRLLSIPSSRSTFCDSDWHFMITMLSGVTTFTMWSPISRSA
ncbi:hypothetical protein PBRA_000221 [Plasmodiophora brassicae]|uniref:Uncharacterized protein n=1 Tax=Plasmodiophora brassicae TaxID=37360 RepID=A0A0G4IH54_PLABS|nr:hypothetical protein PBRA_000221 [Plasmodiophora brassicae]